MGKSIAHIKPIKFTWEAQTPHTPKIKWQPLPGFRLQAYTDDVAPRGFERGLNESDMDPIQAWSIECRCGERMSFNVWKFANEKHITMFLMKWAS